MSHPAWAPIFLNALPARLKEQASGWTELESLLSKRVEAAQQCWPAFSCDAKEFVHYLATKFSPQVDISEQLSNYYIEDLYLAYGCVCHQPSALQEFQRVYSPRHPSNEEEEVWQLVCIKLFVEPTFKISEYNASGPLSKWLKIVSFRTKIDWNRNQSRHKQTDDHAISVAAYQALGHDPELAYLKKSSQHDFVDVMKQALDLLTDKERELLKQHWLCGFSLEQIAALHSVHRATAARWLERGRNRWLSIIRELLIRRLGSPERVSSLWPLICSQFSVRMSQLM